MDFEKYCRDEYIDHRVYSYLAKLEKNEERKKILENFGKMEHEHYIFWKSLMKKEMKNSSLDNIRIKLFILFKYIFGLIFTIKLMERNEKKVIEEYKKLLNKFEGETKQKLELIIKDEIEHENFWMNQIKDETTRYLGFIILGLADAIIEITGVHAGFLGVTASTIIAGIAGLVVGISASLAMASAAYLQAKQDEGSNPRISAIYTGVFYILAAVALATPYFMTHDMLVAFLSSLAIAVMLIGFFNFYSSVIFERKFAKEFLTSTTIILVTASISFIVGEILGNIFGIPQHFK
jgi:VIT1/CCC1 family predicted Fe2+/Mn2+ transporter